MMPAEPARASAPAASLPAAPAPPAPAPAPLSIQRVLGNALVQWQPGYGAPARPPWLEPDEATLDQLRQCVGLYGPLQRADCYDMVLGVRLTGESLDGKPLAERQDLTLRTGGVGPAWTAAIGQFFRVPPIAGPPLAAGQRVEVGTSVDPRWYDQARAAGQYLLTSAAKQADPAKSVLPPNSTVSLELLGGQIFRFTRLGDSTLLVEQADTSAPAPADVPDAPVTDRSFTIGARTYRVASGWRSSEYARLKAALAQFPAALLPPAGTEFAREAVHQCKPGDAPYTCDPKAAGSYKSPDGRPRITLYDTAFNLGSTRIGSWPALAFTVAHEVGHALDDDILRRAIAGFHGGAAAEAHVLGLRSPSGRRLAIASRTPRLVNFRREDAADRLDGEYRRAALADGLRADAGKLSHGITDYSETAWVENFAESFALYVADPELLRVLRPAVSAYFEKRFPR